MRLFFVIALIAFHLGLIAEEQNQMDIKNQVTEVLKSTEGVQVIHQYFSANCFNKTWEFIEKDELSEEGMEDMLATAFASLWHWKQRDDCKPGNLSIAYWQLGRVHTLAKDQQTAEKFGKKCLKVSMDAKLDPFYIGYAYEVLIGAALLNDDKKTAAAFLVKAREQLALIEDKENKSYLSADLDKLEAQIK